MPELVSCILATRNRPSFVAQALRYFLRQTYEPSELIVVDDGEERVAGLCSGLAGVRYIGLSELTPAGTKLNIGIDHARGSIVQKLDDDDYYHPDFLKLAARHVQTENEPSLAAWDCFLIFLAGEQALRYSGHGWKAGGTLCFRRKLWETTLFRKVWRDEDFWFLRDSAARIVPVCAPEHYILVRHGRNTWNRVDGFPNADEFLRRFPAYRRPMRELLDPGDSAFYESLAMEQGTGSP